MDPLKYIFQKPMPTGKLAKWQILLSEFDIIYVTQKAVKGQALADHLAENPVGGEYEPLKTYFPDEEVSFVGEDITETYDGWRIFFDRAANFKGVGIGAVLVSEIGQHYPISAKLSIPVEAANKNIKKILRKMVDNHKQWNEKLPFALLGYHTTIRTSTGATPYLLVYGTEAVIPAEVEIPSLRVIQEAELSDTEWIRSRYE
ncbi:uncharacterized protein [Nicotiana tomentosiformis]|uniref:uncharacterized protein n=1 Tax=Nicotiana tomentosiformis TaxID=4098 RepID=UPI00388CB330